MKEKDWERDYNRTAEINIRHDRQKIEEIKKVLKEYLSEDEIGLISSQIRERGYIPGYLYGCSKDKDDGYEYSGREDINLYNEGNRELEDALRKLTKYIYKEELIEAKTEKEVIEVYKKFDSDKIKVIDLLSQGKTYEEIAENINKYRTKKITIEEVQQFEANEKKRIEKILSENLAVQSLDETKSFEEKSKALFSIRDRMASIDLKKKLA